MMTPEREKEIRKQQEGSDGCFEVGELLVELDRVRDELEVFKERDILVDVYLELGKAHDKLREKLEVALAYIKKWKDEYYNCDFDSDDFDEALAKIRGDK